MTENYVSKNQFANALIKYVQNNPDIQLKNISETKIPDHWVTSAEGIINSSLCTVSHGLFDKVFKRNVIIPLEWDDFERQ